MAAKAEQVEIKSGDYQVQVHVIRAQDLKAKNASGSSDPVVFVEVMGEKKNTKVKKNCTSCVFDDLFFFNFKDLETEMVEEATIKVRRLG